MLGRGNFKKSIKRKFGHIIKYKSQKHELNCWPWIDDGYGERIIYYYRCINCDAEIKLIKFKWLTKKHKCPYEEYSINPDLTCNEVLIKKLLE